MTFKPQKGEDGRTRQIAVLRCSTKWCNSTAEMPAKSGANPLYYTNHFARDGWDIDKNRRSCKCPKCIEKSKKEAKAPQPSVILTPEIPEEKPMPPHAEPSTSTVVELKPSTPQLSVGVRPQTDEPAKKLAKLKLSEKIDLAETYLDEHFIVIGEGGFFKDGASDLLGAEASELPLERFIEVRVESYGKLLDVEGLKANAKELTQQLADVERRVNEMTREYQAWNSRFGDESQLPIPVTNLISDTKREVHEFLAERQRQLERHSQKIRNDTDELLGRFEDKVRDALAELKNQLACGDGGNNEAMQRLQTDVDEMKARIAEVLVQIP